MDEDALLSYTIPADDLKASDNLAKEQGKVRALLVKLQLPAAETAKKVAAAAKEKGKKKVKKVAIAMSLVMLEVKPLDDTIDLDALAQKIFSTILQEGLYWKTEFKKEPVAFGIFKLIVGFSLEDEKVSVDDVVERIEALKDLVQSVEIAVFNKI